MEKARKKPLLVGLSGGLDSLVAAYLMKIQKVELYGVMIANTPESLNESGDKIFACHQSESRIESVKKICEHLQIPLTVVRAKDMFQDAVIDPWLNAKIELTKPRSCFNCHQLRMEILFQKMQELGCDGIVTGHYAKLIRPTPDSQVSVHTSNDLAFDQSTLLMSLRQEILNKMTLPLGDLQKKEVIKIAESFELHPPARIVEFSKCLPTTPEVSQLATKLIAPSLLGDGDFILNEQAVARHAGFQTLEFGQELLLNPNRSNEVPRKIIGCNWSENRVLLGSVDAFKDKGAFLTLCFWSSKLEQMKPSKGYILDAQGSGHEVIVFPKKMRAASFELLEGEMHFTPGDKVSIYNRKGKNAKLLVTGFIQAPYKSYPENTVSIEVKGERGPEMVQIDKDFNF